MGVTEGQRYIPNVKFQPYNMIKEPKNQHRSPKRSQTTLITIQYDNPLLSQNTKCFKKIMLCHSAPCLPYLEGQCTPRLRNPEARLFFHQGDRVSKRRLRRQTSVPSSATLLQTDVTHTTRLTLRLSEVMQKKLTATNTLSGGVSDHGINAF